MCVSKLYLYVCVSVCVCVVRVCVFERGTGREKRRIKVARLCPADEGATALAHAIAHNTTLVKRERERQAETEGEGERK